MFALVLAIFASLWVRNYIHFKGTCGTDGKSIADYEKKLAEEFLQALESHVIFECFANYFVAHCQSFEETEITDNYLVVLSSDTKS